ncbi:hypothetical protein G6F43_007227 [Rhizopus delemar]|nr:hypothetical protein G6F43_007227 [Rhizopus delemar]
MTHYYSQLQQQVCYDPHPMYNINQHIRPATNEGYQKEMTPMMTEKHVVYSDPPMTCCDRLCCGCLIITGILVSQFKVPKVDFTGIQGIPSFGKNETMISLRFDLGYSVKNDNIESVTFSSLKAQAFYHGYDHTSIGGGELNDLHISSNAITTIQFPFTIMIDIASQEDQAIVFKLMSDCGLDGNRQEKIRLDYRVEATIDIIGLSIQIPYSDTVDFDCPMNKTLDTLGPFVLDLMGINSTEFNNNALMPIDLNEIPSFKLMETEKSFGFMDIDPLSEGHVLVIPKYHAEFMHQVPDEYLAEMMPSAKKMMKAIGCSEYNILQNNGRLAHQAVPHVHFHLIPKTKETGLGLRWKPLGKSIDEIKKEYEKIMQRL